MANRLRQLTASVAAQAYEATKRPHDPHWMVLHPDERKRWTNFLLFATEFQRISLEQDARKRIRTRTTAQLRELLLQVDSVLAADEAADV